MSSSTTWVQQSDGTFICKTPWVWNEYHKLYYRSEMRSDGTILRNEWSEHNPTVDHSEKSNQAANTSIKSAYSSSVPQPTPPADVPNTSASRAPPPVRTISCTEWLWSRKYHQWYRYNTKSDGQRSCEWHEAVYDKIPQTYADLDGEEAEEYEDYEEPPPAYDSLPAKS